MARDSREREPSGPRINDAIRVKDVRLIDETGTNVGVVNRIEAQERATAAGLDLVEIAVNGEVPVCKLLDYGKFKFQAQKKAAEARKKQKVVEVKELKFRPMIDDHDYDFKFKNIVRFLEEGDKVKATVQFRGREMARTDLGHKLVQKIAADLGERGTLESSPEMAGNRMHAIFGQPRNAPKKP